MQNHNQNEIVSFSIPKIGEQQAGIQDAFCYSSDKTLAAIADGASTSFLPAEWANLLVEYFCHHNQDSITSIHERWEEWLRPMQEEWRKHFIKIKKDETIPWYAQGSRDKDHASATFVGLKLYPPNPAGKKTWEALAMGDSCLFHIKSHSSQLITFPLGKSEEFKTVTDCFHSLPEYKSSPPKICTGFYESEDIFFLATDALAEWIIRDYQNPSGTRWQELISIASQEDFTYFIHKIRHDRLIKNDDTTLLRLKVTSLKSEADENANKTHPKNSSDRHHKFLVLATGIVAVLGIIFAIMWMINNKQNYNASREQNQTTNNVNPSVKSTTTTDNNHSENSIYSPNYPILPIYSAENIEADKPIGDVFQQKEPELKSSLHLWVHTPENYIREIESGKFILTIPDEATPLALYMGKPKPQNLSPQDFAGNLLPGKYSVFDPRDSKTFDRSRWVKIKFRLEKRG